MEFKAIEFVKNLKYMGLGMLAIIIVIGAIILVTMLLNRLTKKNENSETKSNSKLWIALILGVLLVALLLSLYFADGDCAVCLRDGEHTYEGQKYCAEHYEEILAEKCDCEGCTEDFTHEVDKKQYCDKHYMEFLLGELVKDATK